MAGSVDHCFDDEGRIDRSYGLLENRGDAVEAVDEFAFVMLALCNGNYSDPRIKKALDRYYAICRKEEAPPEWWPKE